MAGRYRGAVSVCGYRILLCSDLGQGQRVSGHESEAFLRGPAYLSVPYLYDPNFVGREEEMYALNRTLITKGQVIIGGEEGMGKTALAVDAVYTVRDRYQAVFWFDCRKPPEEQYAAAVKCIAGHNMAHGLPDPSPDPLVAIQEILERNRSLLVFDHATVDVSEHPLLSADKTRDSLITTSDWRLRPDVVLQPLSPEKGAELVLATAYGQDIDTFDPRERLTALRLSLALGNSPYWLIHAGAHLEATGSSMLDILKDLQKQPEATMETLRAREILGGIND